jgi:hypothetical protein
VTESREQDAVKDVRSRIRENSDVQGKWSRVPVFVGIVEKTIFQRASLDAPGKVTPAVGGGEVVGDLFKTVLLVPGEAGGVAVRCSG